MTGIKASGDGARLDDAGTEAIQYGSFRIGGMHLALPLRSLREVVPCKDLVPLPCAVACVAGGQPVRTTVVPVVDLRVVLDRPVTSIADPCVIVMIHDGRMLGLLAERIGEVFCMAPQRAGQVAPDAGSLFDVCVPQGQSHPISVLSPPALMALARVPAILDPEPWRSKKAPRGEPTHLRPHLLMRTGRWHMAVDALEVHSTLPASTVTAGALTRGACLGTIQLGQDTFAAFDLMALCGLGTLSTGGAVPGFVMDCAGARVVFLVDAIVDFADADPRTLVPVAPYAVPRPDLVCGLLPHECVAGAQHWFTLDGPALRDCQEVASMAAATTAGGTTGPLANSDKRQAPRGRAMLTFELGRKAAAPLDQIKEILGCTAQMATWGDGPVMGIAVSRGRSIAVLNLSRLTGWSGKPSPGDANILVVQSGTDLVGFMVHRLCGIETSNWEPTIPTHDGTGGRQTLASVGGVGQEQVVAVIDLLDLASRVQTHERWPARRESNPRPTA